MIYLDNAATSFPKPAQVLRAVCGVLEKIGANPGRSGHRMALAAGRVIFECREELARFLDVRDPARIVFCANCTEALNLAIHGTLQHGDHAVATMLEHNSVLRPLSGLLVDGGISLTLLPPEAGGVVSAEQVRRSLRPTTRLVAINHVSNVTGAVQPVRQIAQVCRAARVPVLMDAAQSIGTMDVRPEDLGVDLLAAPGHKGLFGPHGTGFLYIGPQINLSTLKEGGTGSLSESMIQPEEMPDRFESGTQNLPGIAGLLTGLRFVQEHKQEIAHHDRALASRAYDGLRNMAGVRLYSPAGSGIVCFNVGEVPSGEVAEQLDQAGIAVRAGLHCAPGAHQHLRTLETGAVRVSPGFFNTERDIDTLLRAVSIIARGVHTAPA
ncbi:MAG: aminotransferase class V-fold PLP-dependent enzyme [Clostridia bacterium]|nr:aminotransferase class V-fold PLP-dependent enzyme [Clostridia bacterium]